MKKSSLELWEGFRNDSGKAIAMPGQVKSTGEEACGSFVARRRRRCGTCLVALLGLLALSAGAGQQLPPGTLQDPEVAAEASGHEHVGDQLLAARRFDQAIVEYQKALAGLPAVPAIHQKLAVAFAESGDMKAAAREFGLVVRLAPGNAKARSNLGMALLKAGDRKGAISRRSVPQWEWMLPTPSPTTV